MYFIHFVGPRIHIQERHHTNRSHKSNHLDNSFQAISQQKSQRQRLCLVELYFCLDWSTENWAKLKDLSAIETCLSKRREELLHCHYLSKESKKSIYLLNWCPQPKAMVFKLLVQMGQRWDKHHLFYWNNENKDIAELMHIDGMVMNRWRKAPYPD